MLHAQTCILSTDLHCLYLAIVELHRMMANLEKGAENQTGEELNNSRNHEHVL